MGKYKDGILGSFSGKVGSVIGASWNGIDYMRSLPRKSLIPETPAQRNQRMKMALLRGFLLGVSDLIKIGYQHVHEQKTTMNAALSYHLKYGTTGDGADLRIDFSRLLYSRGELFVPWSPQVSPAVGQALNFSWTSGPEAPFSNPDDQAALVVYNPSKKQFVTLRNAASRAENEVQMQLPPDYAGDLVHCYMNFIAADESMASVNVYIGSVVIS